MNDEEQRLLELMRVPDWGDNGTTGQPTWGVVIWAACPPYPRIMVLLPPFLGVPFMNPHYIPLDHIRSFLDPRTTLVLSH